MTMEASARRLEQLLHSRDQYIIPVFQRYYSWQHSNWDQLWNDIATVLESDEQVRHFLGCIVCVPAKHEPGKIAGYLVIDGQQRLTTLSILLVAIRDVAKEKSWAIADEITENFLIHKFKQQLEKYKVFPRMRDRYAYFALVDGQQIDKLADFQVYQAYKHFRNRLASNGFDTSQTELERLFAVIANALELVTITLTDENPYKIFKSLNSTGVDLGQGDLIRNLVFMSVPVTDQDEFDETRWRPMEHLFETNGSLDGDAFSAFFRDVLMRDGTTVRENAIYETFEKKFNAGPSPEAWLKELLILAGNYGYITGRKPHTTSKIEFALSLIRDLTVTTSYPLLLRLFELKDQNKVSESDLVICLRSISGFVLRRSVCGDSSQSYGRWFREICAGLSTEKIAVGAIVLDCVKNTLVQKGWPEDQRFREKFLEMNLYDKKFARAVLNALEEQLQSSSEKVVIEGCSIEHVMPQVLDDSEDGDSWRNMLGVLWNPMHETWLHTPGNLTLVGADYNQSMQNKSYEKKRPVLANSRMYLNKHFGLDGPGKWTDSEIQERALKLYRIAEELWISASKPLTV